MKKKIPWLLFHCRKVHCQVEPICNVRTAGFKQRKFVVMGHFFNHFSEAPSLWNMRSSTDAEGWLGSEMCIWRHGNLSLTRKNKKDISSSTLLQSCVRQCDHAVCSSAVGSLCSTKCCCHWPHILQRVHTHTHTTGRQTRMGLPLLSLALYAW